VNKSLLGVGIASELGRKKREGNRAAKSEVLGFEHHFHPSAADVFEDLVVRFRLYDGGRHDTLFYYCELHGG
jgi:hypothetical protein